jgi:hypothetical protein
MKEEPRETCTATNHQFAALDTSLRGPNVTGKPTFKLYCVKCGQIKDVPA